MSTKLRIRIKKLIDPELDLKLDYGELVRLSILIRFKTDSGWSKLYEAIIDTNEVEFYGFCAIDDRVPLILGFKGLLDRFAIHFDIGSGVAYLER